MFCFVRPIPTGNLWWQCALVVARHQRNECEITIGRNSNPFLFNRGLDPTAHSISIINDRVQCGVAKGKAESCDRQSLRYSPNERSGGIRSRLKEEIWKWKKEAHTLLSFNYFCRRSLLVLYSLAIFFLCRFHFTFDAEEKSIPVVGENCFKISSLRYRLLASDPIVKGTERFFDFAELKEKWLKAFESRRLVSISPTSFRYNYFAGHVALFDCQHFSSKMVPGKLASSLRIVAELLCLLWKKSQLVQ